MATRIYEVKLMDGATRLIEAASKGVAWRYVADGIIVEAKLADGKRIAELVAAGTKLEQAT